MSAGLLYVPGAPYGLVSRWGRNWQVHVDSSHRDACVMASCSAYSDFAGLAGTILKDEARTTITCIRGLAGEEDGESAQLVLKSYRYPHPARMRTLWARSKAQREFEGLQHCRGLGVPTVEPVAWGVARTPAGLVRSCFVITRYARGFVTLRDWLKAGHSSEPGARRLLAGAMSEMGACFRRMHGTGFFHFRPATKDVLVRRCDDGRLAWKIVDFAYARFMGQGALARWAQTRDLGILIGSVMKYADAEALESFWTSYLPDPLGGRLSENLLRRARRKGQAQINRNLVHRAERHVKRWVSEHLRRGRPGQGSEE